MKKTFTVLLASTALTAAIGLPAWSAMRAPADGESRLVPALFGDETGALPFVLASDDGEDDDHGYGYRESSRRGHDDDDERGHDDDDDDDGRGGGRNPAPAGTAAPPQNGLFGNGTPPKVQVN